MLLRHWICCCIWSLASQNILTRVQVTHLKYSRLKPPFLERAVHSVYYACLARAFVILWVCFPFWFWGWDVGFDCISSWSLPFFLRFIESKTQVCNNYLKSSAYKTIVHPQLEYTSNVWSPCTSTDINKLEPVQCRTARWSPATVGIRLM